MKLVNLKRISGKRAVTCERQGAESKWGQQQMEASGENVIELVKNSLLYLEFLAEREEISRHKWIESEKMGHDIGFERALVDWTIKHRSAWLEHRKKRFRGEQ